MAETLAESLRIARLARGETLDQVSQKIHVRTAYLEALEKRDIGALPSRVQGRGFLRLYAAHLGLPVQACLDAWDSNSPLPEDVLTPSPQPLGASSLPQPIPAPLRPEPEPAEPASEVEELPAEEVLEDGEPAGPAAVELPEEDIDEEHPPAPAPASSAAEKLIQIGVILRQQRELLGLTLGDVERHTHVRQHYLKALETGRLEDLPSPVQGRGMLNNVAGFLGLDPDQLLTTFAEALQARRQASSALPQVQPGKRPPTKSNRRPTAPKHTPTWRRILTPDLLIGSILIIALFIFAVWSASQVSALQTQASGPTIPPISAVILQSATATPAESVTPTLPQGVGTQLAGEGANGNSSATQPAPTITFPPGISGSLQLVAIAHNRTYMRVVVDGAVAFDGRVVPGNAYPFGGSKQIELLVGSADALQVIFNQNDLGSLGQVGQVVTLIFNKNGVVTPTAQFTSTATRTEVPTSTLVPSPTLPTRTITPYIPNP